MTDTASGTATSHAGGGYVVLRQAPAGHWNEVKATKTAKSADAAIRQVVGTLNDADQSGTFVAVPSRSWRPVRITPVTTTSLLVEEAS
jgi:hypothetical protein